MPHHSRPGTRTRTRAQFCAIGVLGLCLAPMPAMPSEDGIHLVEQEIKAGLLYNFMKYTDWPEGAPDLNTPMVVCLFGGDPFDGRLQPMSGRTVNQHVIEIREPKTAGELTMCSLLFVHANAKPQWPQLRAALAERAMLTVSDFDGFADSGGMIEFTRMNNRIGIRIDFQAVMAAHLQVQDRLQRLASRNRDGASAR